MDGTRALGARRRGVLWGCLALLMAIPLALTGCKVNRSDYRFRMTVEVETPQGLRSGSSVYAVWAANDFPGSQKRLWRVSGEAVAVDLPDGRTLFALLRTNAHFEDMVGLSMTALDPGFTSQYDVVGTAKRFEAMDGNGREALVDPANYPMLVTFRDIDDPASVELVDPDNLAASFGEGVKLKRITVQITDDSVTTGIEKRLGWLKRGADGGLDRTMGVNAQPTLAQQLSFLDFRRN